MITEVIFGIPGVILLFVVGLIPDIPNPQGFDQVNAAIDQITPFLANIGYWIPIDVIVFCIKAIMICWGISIVVNIVRFIVSLFTGGGGSMAAPS